MKYIFINLKRFEVPRPEGGLCPLRDPIDWIKNVMEKTYEQGLSQLEGLRLAYLLPESLVPSAIASLRRKAESKESGIEIGCQGVHWKNIEKGKNFGAFTSCLPARSAKNIGSDWAMIGHSEERRAKLELLETYDPRIKKDRTQLLKALDTVNSMIGQEVLCAIASNLKVLLCIGETAKERGEGDFSAQKPRVRSVLEAQIKAATGDLSKDILDNRIVIGYEPVWAIGPGKTPPGQEYISFVSDTVKEILRERFGAEYPVVYGGGLKKENASMLAGIKSIDGGLVALTKFTGEIGFSVDGLVEIVNSYFQG